MNSPRTWALDRKNKFVRSRKNKMTEPNKSVFERIYDQEMNFQVSCFWDGGYTFRLGDETNGFSYTEHFDKWGDGLKWFEEMLNFASDRQQEDDKGAPGDGGEGF